MGRPCVAPGATPLNPAQPQRALLWWCGQQDDSSVGWGAGGEVGVDGAVGAVGQYAGAKVQNLVQGPRPQICWHRLSWWEMLPVKGWPPISCASVCTPASPVSTSLYRLVP